MIMSVDEAGVKQTGEKLGTRYFYGINAGDVREISNDKLFYCAKGDEVSRDTSEILKELAIDDESWSVGVAMLDNGRYLFVRAVELEVDNGIGFYLIHEQDCNMHDRVLAERLYVVGLNDQAE